jgi:hypothetical protein
LSDHDPLELSQEQRDDIQQRISAKWVGKPECPVCLTKNWALASHALSAVTLNPQGGGMNIGSQTYPQAQLVCTNCGYTLHFNLPVLGVDLRLRQLPAKPEQDDGNG